MSMADDVKTLFDADNGAGGVATLLTGGIYTFDGTGQNGISPENTPSAYSGSKVQPCCLVKLRGEIPDGGVMDDAMQVMSYRQVVEIWMYDDASEGYGTMEVVKDRIFGLLHGKPIGANSNILRWVGNVLQDKEPELQNAVFMRIEYDFHALMTAS